MHGHMNVKCNDSVSELIHPETFLYEGERLTSLVNHLVRHFVCLVSNYVPGIPVPARSNAWVYGRFLAEIAGSNPAGSIVVCLL